MKLKNLILRNQVNHPQNLHKYESFIESDIAKKSIKLDKEGRIISDKLSLLKFIDFLLTQYKYCPENNNTKEFGKNTDKLKNKDDKKKSKKLRYDQLTLKQKKKRIKNMDHFINGSSEYPV